MFFYDQRKTDHVYQILSNQEKNNYQLSPEEFASLLTIATWLRDQQMDLKLFFYKKLLHPGVQYEQTNSNSKRNYLAAKNHFFRMNKDVEEKPIQLARPEP